MQRTVYGVQCTVWCGKRANPMTKRAMAPSCMHNALKYKKGINDLVPHRLRCRSHWSTHLRFTLVLVQVERKHCELFDVLLKLVEVVMRVGF